MLAKQVWRLQHDKESLLYRVFKTKFFQSGDVFDATVKSGSYAWWSILNARKVIVEGVKWRIGNGCPAQIYQDNWLLGEVISLCTDLPETLILIQASEWIGTSAIVKIIKVAF